jgi:hypothetical protein
MSPLRRYLEPLHVRDRLADVRLPGGDLASLEHGGLHLRIVHHRLLDLAELRPVLAGGEDADCVGRPPIMVASTVTFSAPYLRAGSHPFLSCFCTSSQLTPGFGWIVINETIVTLAPLNAWWLLAG